MRTLLHALFCVCVQHYAFTILLHVWKLSTFILPSDSIPASLMVTFHSLFISVKTTTPYEFSWGYGTRALQTPQWLMGRREFSDTFSFTSVKQQL